MAKWNDWFPAPFKSGQAFNPLDPRLLKMVEGGKITLEEAQGVDMSQREPRDMRPKTNYVETGYRGLDPRPIANAQRDAYLPPAQFGAPPRMFDVQSFWRGRGLGRGGTPGGGGGLASQVSEYNRANQNRLNQIMRMLATLGGAERGRINTESREQLALTRQRLLNRGLGASSIVEAATRRAQTSREERLQRLAEMLTGRRAGVLERVSDQPPPVDAWLQYTNQLAGSGG